MHSPRASLRRSPRAAALLFSSLFVLACESAPVGQPALDSAREAIIGGSFESGWPAVGALVADYASYGYYGSFCTGTLVAPQWVLTAAHCVTGDGRNPPPSAANSFFYVGSDARPTGWGERPAGQYFAVDRFYVHPDWDDVNTRNDIALVRLSQAVTGVTPIPYNAGSLSSSLSGEPVFYVGFGVTDGDSQTGGGVKRSAYIDLHMIHDTYFVSMYSGTGICFGDSGGPALYRFAGQWLVMGVNSSVATSDPNGDPCEGYYYDTRVDAFAPWIEQYVAGVAPDCNVSPSLCLCAAACRVDGSCNDSACRTLDCAGAMDCVYDCGASDAGCEEDCLALGTFTGTARAEALLGCFDSNCARFTGEAWQDCVWTNCAVQVDACWPPADCDLRGGDCEPGTACHPTQSGATDCFPSDERTQGQSCDPALGDRLACADGLLCLDGGGEAVCLSLCFGIGDCASGERCQAPVFEDVAELGVCLCRDEDGDGYCAGSEDCDDTRREVNPGAAELCDDGIDNDCDGLTDGDDPDCGGVCTDADGDGYCAEDADCDDTRRAVNPGAAEQCGDGIDNDCDGQTDEGCEGCVDEDGDGYCADVDCDDRRPEVNPGQAERCGDYLDNDCDGQVNEDCDTCEDKDGDGYCAHLDCNDNDANIHPGAHDLCGDGIDGDCDGVVDGGCPESCIDWDGDGYCDFVDCDDGDPSVSPAADELCGDGIDNDCDGQTDEGCPPPAPVVEPDLGGGACSHGATSGAGGAPVLLLVLLVALVGRRLLRAPLRAASAFVLLAALPACELAAPAAGEWELASREQAIVNGSLEYGWQGVGALTVMYSGYGYAGSFCTATLIAPRWVLTAAHCLVEHEGMSLTPQNVRFFVGNDARPDWSGEPRDGALFRVESFHVYPGYTGVMNINDIGLVRLAAPLTGVSIYPFSDLDIPSSWVDSDVFYVGFGVTNGANQSGGGVKRSTTLPIDSIYDSYYAHTYADSNSGVCFGDSGGPGLREMEGEWRVVGVNSAGDSSGYDPCKSGYSIHTRTDAYARWLYGLVGGGPPDCALDAALCACDEACVEDGRCDDALCAPGAVGECVDERCGDGLDNDCDGFIDEDCGACVDADGDGYCADVTDEGCAPSVGADEPAGGEASAPSAVATGGCAAGASGSPWLLSFPFLLLLLWRRRALR